ncbi:E3 ubiquitin-protein ligase DZIP3-like [Saccostrea cucullata]|uniref:E3 ubiquitin-protein ligase DZIP3-like n=1 Tax=Saccostrea cuccullata TaxID=36930 RepID=UPI002ED6654B
MQNPKYGSTKEKTHAARVSRLIGDPCSDLFRDILRNHVTEMAFPGVLQREKSNLSPILNRAQRELLYPHKGQFQKTYEDFDLSLLYTLLRNISGINSHSKGWGKPPDPADRSISANIDRIREIRNTYCGHSASVSLSDQDFSNLWQDASVIIAELEKAIPESGTKYSSAAKILKSENMDPEQEEYHLAVIDKQNMIMEDLSKKQEKAFEEFSKEMAGIEHFIIIIYMYVISC